MPKISLIVPCYNEEKALPFFYEEVCSLAQKMDYVEFEFLFVDDGSKDKTVEVIEELYKKDRRVKYLSFSRNFGKEAAIYAGLSHSEGDYVAILDADLQDPPALIEEMYRYIVEEGYDSVATRRVSRKGEPPIRSFFARLFYKIINKISKADIVDGARDFRLMTRQMTDAILSMQEYNRFSKGIFGWVGFKTKWLEYVNVERVAGETKWSFWKLFIYSIEGITAFSTMPLAISSIIGVLMCLISFVAIIVIIVRHFLGAMAAYGWASMICITFFLSGIQLFCVGILGQYLSKTYLETKKRPIYIIKENKNNKENENESN